MRSAMHGIVNIYLKTQLDYLIDTDYFIQLYEELFLSVLSSCGMFKLGF